jgi:hypothetical protein
MSAAATIAGAGACSASSDPSSGTMTRVKGGMRPTGGSTGWGTATPGLPHGHQPIDDAAQDEALGAPAHVSRHHRDVDLARRSKSAAGLGAGVPTRRSQVLNGLMFV